MMKRNLLLWGGLIIALPCFASVLTSHQNFIYQQNHAHRAQFLKDYKGIYSAALLAPVSVVQKDDSSWNMTFESEKFDIIRFASGFDSEGHDAILDFIRDQIKTQESSDLIDHPLVVPLWVFWGSKFNFNDWVWNVQQFPQRTGEVEVDFFSPFEVRDKDDNFISKLYCPGYEPSHIEIFPALSNRHLFHQSGLEEYAGAAKLPPVPYPIPLPLPRLSVVVQMDDESIKLVNVKLPPVPYPIPLPLPRLSVVVQMDGESIKLVNAKLPPVPYPIPLPLPRLSVDKMSNGNVKLVNSENAEVPLSFPIMSDQENNKLPLVFWENSSIPLSAWSVISSKGMAQGKTLYLTLYFVVVWPIVTPEGQEHQLEQEKINAIKSTPPYERKHHYMDGWSDNKGECDEGTVEVSLLPQGVHSFSPN